MKNGLGDSFSKDFFFFSQKIRNKKTKQGLALDYSKSTLINILLTLQVQKEKKKKMSLVRAFKDNRVNDYFNDNVLTVKVPFQKEMELSSDLSFGQTTTTPPTQSLEDDYSSNKIATEGGTLLLSSPVNGNTPRSIAWRVLENSTILELDPIDLNLKQNHQLRKIRFEIPPQIMKNCITVSEVSDTENIVIDFLSKTGYFYTLYFGTSEFLDNTKQSMSDKGHSLTEERAHKWLNVQYPYHFEFNRPHLLYNVSVNIFVASAMDGSLIKLTRSSPLDDLASEVFNDPNKKSSLLQYFLGSHGETVPGWKNLSSRAAVAIISIPAINSIAVLTINRMIQIWSLRSLSLLGKHELKSPKDLPEQERIFIGPTPMKLLAMHVFKKSNEKSDYTYLGVYMPLGDGLFQIFKLHLDPQYPKLEELGPEYELIPQVPDSYSTWVVNGFTIFNDSRSTPNFEISIMWKSNTSSAFYKTTLPNKSQNEVNWFVDCSTRDSSNTLNSNIHHSNQVEYYVEKTFGIYTYSKIVVEKALGIYEKHYSLQNYSLPKSLSLKTQVMAIISLAARASKNLDQSTPEYQKDLIQQWNKFDVLCAELQRSADEVLSIDWDPVLELFWASRAGHSSIIRPALPLEVAYANRTSEPSNIISTIAVGTLINTASAVVTRASKSFKSSDCTNILVLLDAFTTLRSKLSPTHINEIYEALTKECFSSKNDASSRLTELYKKYLARHISQKSLSTFETSLSNIDDLYTELLILYELINSEAKKQDEGVFLTKTGCLFVSQVFYNYILLSRSILLDVLIAIIVTIPSKTIVIQNNVDLYVKFLDLFKSINAISECFKVDTGVDIQSEKSQNDMVSNEASIITSSNQLTMFEQFTIQTSFPEVIDITGLKPVIFQLVSQWKLSADNDFVTPYQFIVKLITEDSIATAQKLARYFSVDDSFSQLINASIALRGQDGDKAKEYFTLAATGLEKERLSKDKLVLVFSLFPASLFSNESFGSGKATFYLAASKAALHYDLDNSALALAKAAQASLKPDQLDVSVYDHLFNTAIKLSQFEDAQIAVNEIEKVDGLKLKQLSDTERLIASQQHRLVTPYIETLAGCLVRAEKLKALENLSLSKSATRIVTDFLFKQALTSLTCAVLGEQSEKNKEDINPFLYYNVLYSWSIYHDDFKEGKWLLPKKKEKKIFFYYFNI